MQLPRVLYDDAKQFMQPKPTLLTSSVVRKFVHANVAEVTRVCTADAADAATLLDYCMQDVGDKIPADLVSSFLLPCFSSRHLQPMLSPADKALQIRHPAGLVP